MPRLTVPSSHHSNFFLPTSHLPLTLMSLSSYSKDLCVYIALTQIIEDNLPDSKPLTYLYLKVPLTVRYCISGSCGELMDVTLPNTIMRKRWVEFLDFRSQRFQTLLRYGNLNQFSVVSWADIALLLEYKKGKGFCHCVWVNVSCTVFQLLTGLKIFLDRLRMTDSCDIPWTKRHKWSPSSISRGYQTY